MEESRFSRREVLKLGGTVTALGIVLPRSLLGMDLAQAGKAEVEYRVLGRTGLKVSTVSIGCMTSPEAVIAKAFDMGINWFDTAHTYKGGRNEEEVGRALAGKRDQAYICTKLPRGSTASMLAKLDVSLKRLQTDHVDLLLAHGVSSSAGVSNDASVAALEKAKKDGKTRFIGVSTHSRMAEVIDAAVNANAYDAVLTVYNFDAPKELHDAIARANKAGVGIIAMKTQRGNIPSPAGGLTPHQAMLKWVLENENVACAIPAMQTFKQLEENVGVMGKRLGFIDRRRLEHYAAATAGMYCTGCAGCAGTCPRDVDIAAVRRCAMYLNGYRDEALARERYGEIASNASACLACAHCTARCVRGVSLQPVLKDAHKRLA